MSASHAQEDYQCMQCEYKYMTPPLLYFSLWMPWLVTIEVIVMTVPGMSEWKKNNGPNRKFPVDACMPASFFQLHKSTCSFSSRKPFTKLYLAPFPLKQIRLLYIKGENMILLTLTFFDDRLICHNNVVVYMLKEKRLGYYVVLREDILIISLLQLYNII